MIKKIQLAVFDMSGTTIKDNNEVLDCFYDALIQTGISRDKKQINTMMGWSKIEVFRTLWTEEMGVYTVTPSRDEAKSIKGVEKKAQRSFSVFKSLLEEYYYSHPVEPTQGCLEIFDYLRKENIKIALNTGFYRQVTDILLNKLNWKVGDIIDFSITSDEVPKGRPQPFMIQTLMNHFNVKNPHHVFKIGDTPSDLMEGRAAGCWSFGLTNGSHTREELELYNNDGLFESLEAFLTFLKTKETVELETKI